MIINGGGPKLKGNIDILNVGDNIPQASGVSETKITIKNEKIEKEPLNNYLDKVE